MGVRRANAFGTGTAYTPLARAVPHRSTAEKKPKSVPDSWWNVPEDEFAAAAKAERARLANVESPPKTDKWG